MGHLTCGSLSAWPVSALVQGSGSAPGPSFVAKWAAVLPNLVQLFTAAQQIWSPEVISALSRDPTAQWLLCVSNFDFTFVTSESIESALPDPPPRYSPSLTFCPWAQHLGACLASP